MIRKSGYRFSENDHAQAKTACGRYPPSPVPAQGCTSHPGHNAGRHDAQAARERTANPPAGTALAPMARCASGPCPFGARMIRGNIAETVTNVKGYVTRNVTTFRQP